MDPAKDAVFGKWTRVPSGLHGERLPDGKGAQTLQLPYHPPQEYDFRVAYTTMEGNCEATQIVSVEGKQFTWATGRGSYPDKYACFGIVDGELANGPPFGVKLSSLWEVNRRYESLVEVRRDRATGYIDGKKYVELKMDGRELSNDPSYVLPDTSALGIGIWWGKTVFHEIFVREVTGKGKFLR